MILCYTIYKDYTQGGMVVPEILKAGSLEDFVDNQTNKQLKWKHFYCYKCGCDFNAHKMEYKYIWYKFGYYCMCPTCSSMVREFNDYFG